MTFQDELNQLNAAYFFREFTFSKNEFKSARTTELELADSVICLDDLMIVFQVKERASIASTSEGAELKWFKDSVKRDATRQIRNTLSYFRDYGTIEVANHRSHRFKLVAPDPDRVHKVVCYRAHPSLPISCREQKYHRSTSTGFFMHLLPEGDYVEILRVLVTPAEVAEYLTFRSALVSKHSRDIGRVPETALLGQYLSGDLRSRPSSVYSSYHESVTKNSAEWDMSSIIEVFHDRLTFQTSPMAYYPIIREIAKLNRAELREFKSSLKKSLDHARDNDPALSYRMTSPRTDCGFVLVPLCEETRARWEIGLKSETILYKYEKRSPKCVGVSIAADGGAFEINWCYMEGAWEQTAELDRVVEQFLALREAR